MKIRLSGAATKWAARADGLADKVAPGVKAATVVTATKVKNVSTSVVDRLTADENPENFLTGAYAKVLPVVETTVVVAEQEVK